jgi:hypothetical protein
LLTAGIIELVADAVVFLGADGVDADTAFKALGGGLAGSAVLERRAPDMQTRQFRLGFKGSLHHKDLGMIMAAARDAGVIVLLGAVVTQLMASLVTQGHGDLDNTALLKLIEELSGKAGEHAGAACPDPGRRSRQRSWVCGPDVQPLSCIRSVFRFGTPVAGQRRSER